MPSKKPTPKSSPTLGPSIISTAKKAKLKLSPMAMHSAKGGAATALFALDPFMAHVVPQRFRTPLTNKHALFMKSRHKKHVRVAAQKTPKHRWGFGLDEMHATRELVANTHHLTAPQVSAMFNFRVPTASLVWATSPGAKSALAGHTPALKSKISKGTSDALTEEHNVRDGMRAQAVAVETDQPSVGVKAILATVKYMMSPAEELRAQQGRLQTQALPVYGVHTKFGDLRKGAELSKFAAHQQPKRERLKWLAAAELSRQGKLNLVPPAYQAFLAHAPNTEQAMQAFSHAVRSGHQTANTSATSQTDDLRTDTLSKMNAAPPKTRPRALSNPRLI